MRLLGLSGKVEETVNKYQSIKTQENTQTPSNHQFKSESEIPHHSQQISAMSNSMEITDMHDDQIKSIKWRTVRIARQSREEMEESEKKQQRYAKCVERMALLLI